MEPKPERIELRCEGGPLLGVLVVRDGILEVKRGRRVFEVDLRRTLAVGVAVVIERERSKSGAACAGDPTAKCHQPSSQ